MRLWMFMLTKYSLSFITLQIYSSRSHQRFDGSSYYVDVDLININKNNVMVNYVSHGLLMDVWIWKIEHPFLSTFFICKNLGCIRLYWWYYCCIISGLFLFIEWPPPTPWTSTCLTIIPLRALSREDIDVWRLLWNKPNIVFHINREVS